MPPDPLRAFIATQSALNLYCWKIRLKKSVEIMPLSIKISRYATGVQKGADGERGIEKCCTPIAPLLFEM